MIVGVLQECGDNSGQERKTRAECNNQPLGHVTIYLGREGWVCVGGRGIRKCWAERRRGKQTREQKDRGNVIINPLSTYQFISAVKGWMGDLKIPGGEEKRRKEGEEGRQVYHILLQMK